MLQAYQKHVQERENVQLPPLPLSAEQVASLVELLKNPSLNNLNKSDEVLLLDLLENQTPAGVDQAAYVKAAFLADVAKGTATSPLISPEKAVQLLGTMLGGYNVQALVELLSTPMAAQAVTAFAASCAWP